MKNKLKPTERTVSSELQWLNEAYTKNAKQMKRQEIKQKL